MAKSRKHPRAHLHARPPHKIAGSESILLDEVGAEKLIGVSRHQLRALRARGAGRVITKLGRSVRYRVTDIERWLDENRVEPREFRASKRAANATKLRGA